MKIIKVGIIDDDESKVTQITTYLLYDMKDAQRKRLIGIQILDFKFSKFHCLFK